MRERAAKTKKKKNEKECGLMMMMILSTGKVVICISMKERTNEWIDLPMNTAQLQHYRTHHTISPVVGNDKFGAKH